MNQEKMLPVEELEKKFLTRVKGRVNSQTFQTWFSLLKILSVEGGLVGLGVPNSFWAEWMKAHFLDIIEDNLREVLGQGIRISFQVVPELGQGGSEVRGGFAPAGPSDRGESVILLAASRPLSGQAGLPESSLSPKYTFATFVIGDCNQFAHAAAVAVAAAPARVYNPLFLYGGVGLGKTHLLNAIGHQVLAGDATRRVVYLSAEKFMNELINSIRFDRMAQFREKFRHCEALLIDDIQFISGKERTQEEFFHTFNSLYESHRQIVVSSDRFPKEICGLEERLRSRFEWGLIADLQPPDIETRVAILKKKAQQERVALPTEVAFFVASVVESNIRELEGALIRISAFSSLTGRPITLDLAKEALKGLVPDGQRAVTVAEIQKVVASFYQIKVADLKSPRRLKAISVPRQMAMHLTRSLTDLSFPEIGREFGNKDHSTVIHAVRKVEQGLKSSSKVHQEMATLRKALKV